MYEAEIAKGIAAIERGYPPEWRSKVNLDNLDLDDHQFCVLGQLSGSFYWGLRHLGIPDSEVEDYGFMLDASALDSDYDRLTNEWKVAIANV